MDVLPQSSCTWQGRQEVISPHPAHTALSPAQRGGGMKNGKRSACVVTLFDGRASLQYAILHDTERCYLQSTTLFSQEQTVITYLHCINFGALLSRADGLSSASMAGSCTHHVHKDNPFPCMRTAPSAHLAQSSKSVQHAASISNVWPCVTDPCLVGWRAGT